MTCRSDCQCDKCMEAEMIRIADEMALIEQREANQRAIQNAHDEAMIIYSGPFGDCFYG